MKGVRRKWFHLHVSTQVIFAVQSPEYGKYLGEQGQEVSTRGTFKVP